MGSPISLFLFNISMEEVLQDVFRRINILLFNKVYADDMYLQVPERSLKEFLSVFIEVADETGLMINKKSKPFLKQEEEGLKENNKSSLTVSQCYLNTVIWG